MLKEMPADPEILKALQILEQIRQKNATVR
jgi:hypothetical protein